MSTIPVRWPEVRAVFEACAALPAAERAPALAAAALQDHERDEVASLLAHHDTAASPLDAPAARALAGPVARVGERLGAWEVVRPLGSGGMGDVVEVRRADGRFEQRAAAKLLRRGMDSAAVLRRFAHERQALARLAHPHIARLLDAGASAEGLPFFVMEYVDGEPIDAAARALPQAGRLRLFMQLADAVAHAHRNLLLHRDLKPGNVLVDRSGQVKLLDFGIAKALDPRADSPGNGNGIGDSDGNATATGVRAYTPDHAAPEQWRGEPVSTATDVHGLGRLLYRMLTGQNAAIADARWPANRRPLERDLDAVVLKALAAVPAERYASADAMAADVQAVLDGRPVSVRAAHPAYVLGKLIRRHPASSAAGALGIVGSVFGLAAALAQQHALGALGVVGLAGGLGIALREARRSAAVRRVAEAHAADLRRLSREIVVGFGQVVRHLPGGREQQATLLLTSVDHLERLLQAGGAADPGLIAELAVAHAELSHLRGMYEFNAHADAALSQRHGERAVELAAQCAAAGDVPLHQAWARALCDLARLAQHRRALDEAARLLDESDAVLERALARWPGDAALLRQRASNAIDRGAQRYGWDRPNAGDPEGALAAFRDAEVQHRELARVTGVARDVFEIGTAINAGTLVLIRQQRFAEALVTARAGLAERERGLAMEPHNRTLQGGVAADHNLVAGLSLDVGDVPGALAASAAGWAALQTLLEEDPGNESWTIQRRWLAFHHGRALLGCARAAEALPVLDVSGDWLQALEERGEASTRQRVRLARTRVAQAQAERALGREGGSRLAEAARVLGRLSAAEAQAADARAAMQELAAAGGVV